MTSNPAAIVETDPMGRLTSSTRSGKLNYIKEIEL